MSLKSRLGVEAGPSQSFVLRFQAGGPALAEEGPEPRCFRLWETEAESHTSSLPRQAPLLRLTCPVSQNSSELVDWPGSPCLLLPLAHSGPGTDPPLC